MVLIDVVGDGDVLLATRMMALDVLSFVSANDDGVEPGGQID